MARQIGTTPRRSGQFSAVPQLKGHANIGKGRAMDDDGNVIASRGSGEATSVIGRAYCKCGVRSELLPSLRERKLWYTRHREEIAGVPWQ